MKIVHVIPSLPYGGMQRLVAQIAEEQCRRGRHAHVLAVYESTTFADDLRGRGVPFLVTPGTRPSVIGARAFRAHLRSLQPDVVHLHGGLLWSNTTSLFLKREPWIQHVHSYPDSLTGMKGAALRVINARLCDGYIGISRSVAEAVRVHIKGSVAPVYTIYNGIAPCAEPVTSPPNSPDTPVFGMATRLAQDKGVWEFIAVAAAILKLQRSARFVLAGDGPLAPPLREFIRNNGWEHCFSLPGHIAKVDEFWRSLDVALFTAPREPLGLRILEPMTAGIPVAAYRTGFGSDELIVDGITGRQAQWADAPALARHAVELTRNLALWQSISTAAAREVRERFSLREMCNRLDQVYDVHKDSSRQSEIPVAVAS